MQLSSYKHQQSDGFIESRRQKLDSYLQARCGEDSRASVRRSRGRPPQSVLSTFRATRTPLLDDFLAVSEHMLLDAALRHTTHAHLVRQRAASPPPMPPPDTTSAAGLVLHEADATPHRGGTARRRRSSGDSHVRAMRGSHQRHAVALR